MLDGSRAATLAQRRRRSPGVCTRSPVLCSALSDVCVLERLIFQHHSACGAFPVGERALAGRMSESHNAALRLGLLGACFNLAEVDVQLTSAMSAQDSAELALPETDRGAGIALGALGSPHAGCHSAQCPRHLTPAGPH